MSTIKANTLLHSDGTQTTEPSIPALDQRMAKAWVNFNGTGTVAIRDSYNVSSITDNGTGDYTVNFTTAMANVNFAASCFIGRNGVDGATSYTAKEEYASRTTNSVVFNTLFTSSASSAAFDFEGVQAIVFAS